MPLLFRPSHPISIDSDYAVTCRGKWWNLSSHEIVLLIHHSSSSSSSVSRFARNPTNCPPTHLRASRARLYPLQKPLVPESLPAPSTGLLIVVPSPLFRTGGDVRINSLVTWSKWRKKEKLERAVPRELSFRWIRAKITESRWRKREREG